MKGIKSTPGSIIIIFIAILFAEIAVFNFPFWESLTYEKPGGYTQEVNNETDRTVIEITNPDFEIQNLHLFVADYPSNRPIPVKITFSDAGKYDLELPETEVIKSVPESLYIKLSPDGKISNLKIEVFNNIYQFDPGSIQLSFNETRPFELEVIRVITLSAIAMTIYFLLPSSKLYKIKLFDPDKKINKKCFPLVLLTVSMFIIIWISTVFTFSEDGSAGITKAYNSGSVEAIYSFQADAFLDGHAYLNIEAPDFLSKMEDPYNPSARAEISKQTGEYSRLDFAYYKGKYYCYYGVVPAVLFYMPFKLISGLPAKNSHFILMAGVLFLIEAIRLILALCKRINKNISIGVFIILSIAFVFGSISLCCAYNTSIYTVPNISALLFVTCGLVSWLGASEKSKDGKIPGLPLVLGSICMILAVGCRPTYGVFVLSALPVFEREIRNKTFFTRKSLANTLCVIVPFLIIGSILLYYNYIRFDNPLNFGSNYNLSDANLNGKSWGIRNLGVGIFEYLFQPIYMKADYPYFYSIYNLRSLSQDYMGYMFFSPTFGGYFHLAPISLFIVKAFKRKRSLKENKLYYMVIFSIIAAILLLIIDIEMAGIAIRYQLDFSLLIILAAIIVICDISADPEIENNKVLSKIFISALCVLTLITVISNMGIMISDSQFYPLKYLSPDTYYYIKYNLFVLR